MELKPDYIPSEFGPLPSTWKVQTIGEIFSVTAGGDVDEVRTRPERTEAFPYPVYSNALTDHGLYGYSSIAVHPRNTITVTARGMVGSANFRDHPYTAIGRVLVLQARDGFEGHYFDAAINAMIEFANESTGVPQLTAPQIYGYRLPVPPLEEQRAIATVLSDVNALIAGLERLIAKKRDIKQAAMQQLLTGQTRLPGFSGEWEHVRLGDHVQFLKNGVNSRAELTQEGKLKYLHYGDIHGASDVVLDVARTAMPCLPHAKAATLDRLCDGDLVFADASEDMGGIGKAVEIRGASGSEVVSGLHTIAARFDKKILADGFKAYLQFMPPFSRHLKRLAAGTKVFATNRGHVASVELELPGLLEQTAIATILSDIDAELSALETRLAKTRAIKQGMMQELLTGRTRLVDSIEQVPAQEQAPTQERKANVYFMRSVFAAEIVDQLHHEPTFGHVKFEKILFLAEHLCQVDTGSTYLRKAAGPLDRKALHSIDSQLRTQKWFDGRKENGRYRYVPLEKRGGHKGYFDRYFVSISSQLSGIAETLRTWDTERCEIVATLYAAWKDLLHDKGAVSDDMILHEVLNNWHQSKQRIPEERWLKALSWMRDKGYVPSPVASTSPPP